MCSLTFEAVPTLDGVALRKGSLGQSALGTNDALSLRPGSPELPSDLSRSSPMAEQVRGNFSAMKDPGFWAAQALGNGLLALIGLVIWYVARS